MSSRESQGRGSPSVTGDLSFDEIVARYRDKWVLMHITEEEDGWPVRGTVMKVSTSRARLANFLRPKLSDGTLPQPYWAVYAVPYLRTGEELRELLTRPGIENVDA